MSHWAEINNENIVTRVLVGDNNDSAGDEGYQWLIDNLGGTWVKTSYNGNIRYNYAGVGYTYNAIDDAFIAPQPHPSWILNNAKQWEAPIAYPNNGKLHLWNEDLGEWYEADTI